MLYATNTLKVRPKDYFGFVMNTGKILDIAPRWSPDWQPASPRPVRDGPPEIKPVEPALATSATTDLVRRHAADEARRAEVARKAAEAAAQKKAAVLPMPQLARQVGLVAGSFDVYVDLTDPSTKRRVFRVYGPNPQAPVPPPPAIASQAYAAGADALPLLPGHAVATEA
jgi:hypothetical protein